MSVNQPLHTMREGERIRALPPRLTSRAPTRVLRELQSLLSTFSFPCQLSSSSFKTARTTGGTFDRQL